MSLTILHKDTKAVLWTHPDPMARTLRGANLRGANLRGANLSGAKIDKHTIIDARAKKG